MTTLRNASSSRSIETTTTPPMSSGSRSAIERRAGRCRRGRTADVDAVPGAPVAAGITSSRRVLTRSSVAASCGPVVGTTVISAMSPPGGAVAATPPRRPRCCRGRPEPLEGRAVAVGQVRDHEQRPVGAAGRIPRPAGRRPAGSTCLAVRCPRRAGRNGPEERRGQRQQQRRRPPRLASTLCRRPAGSTASSRPLAPGGRRAEIGAVRAASQRQPEPVDAPPEVAEQRGEQGDGGDHHDQRGDHGDARRCRS